jgi:hypothetical protein
MRRRGPLVLPVTASLGRVHDRAAEADNLGILCRHPAALGIRHPGPTAWFRPGRHQPLNEARARTYRTLRKPWETNTIASDETALSDVSPPHCRVDGQRPAADRPSPAAFHEAGHAGGRTDCAGCQPGGKLDTKGATGSVANRERSVTEGPAVALAGRNAAQHNPISWEVRTDNAAAAAHLRQNPMHQTEPRGAARRPRPSARRYNKTRRTTPCTRTAPRWPRRRTVPLARAPAERDTTETPNAPELKRDCAAGGHDGW